MKHIPFSYSSSCSIPKADIAQTLDLLKTEILSINNTQRHLYETDYASLHLPYDTTMLATINKLAENKKRLNPAMVIVIGIGGSNLGTTAIINALKGVWYNGHNAPKIFFADTVDSDYLIPIIAQAEHALLLGQAIILNVISKSGTTTETIANFQLFFELLQKYHPDNYHPYIVITSDKDSKLWDFGKKQMLETLEIPRNVGGRYSVFSPVGLFPLALCGIDIAQLHAGACSALALSSGKTEINSAAISASILALLYHKGYMIHDTFLFSVELESLGKWYRQLMAESIGKSHSKEYKIVNVGITPTVSIGSTDLHSVAQLYLSGPHTTFTTFVSVEQNKENLHLNANALFNGLVSNIDNKPLAKLMDAMLQGTMIAYKNNSRPYVHIAIPKKNEYYIGYFMQMKMVEIMYLGFLMNINPFDQPHVELYKVETKRILSS